MDELKLCPFCGRKAEKGEDRESYECVMCKDCTARVYSMDEDTDVELWNTRPIEDELHKELKATQELVVWYQDKEAEREKRIAELEAELKEVNHGFDIQRTAAINAGKRLMELEENLQMAEESQRSE